MYITSTVSFDASIRPRDAVLYYRDRKSCRAEPDDIGDIFNDAPDPKYWRMWRAHAQTVPPLASCVSSRDTQAPIGVQRQVGGGQPPPSPRITPADAGDSLPQLFHDLLPAPTAVYVQGIGPLC